MNVLHAIWLSSVVGGGAFFSAGFLLKGVFAPKAAMPPGAAPPLLDRARDEREEELQQLRALLQARNAELAEARSQVAESQRHVEQARPILDAAERTRREALERAKRVEAAFDDVATELTRRAEIEAQLADSSAQLNEARAQITTLKSQLSESRSQVLRAKTQLAKAQGDVAALTLRGTELDPLRAENAKLRDENTSAARRAREELARAQADIASLTLRLDEFDKVRAENATLRDAVAELQRQHLGQPVMDLSSFQRKNAELSLKTHELEQRANEFQRQSEENRELKTKLSQLEVTRLENDRLSRRVRELEAQQFAQQSTHIPTLPPAPPLTSNESRTERVQRVLDSFVSTNKDCKVAVLSDLRGFLVAASGEATHQNEIAAAASLTTYTTERMQELLPMSKLEQFEWVDSNRVVVRGRFLDSGEDALLLTTLRIETRSNDPQLDQVGRTISQLMHHAEPAES